MDLGLKNKLFVVTGSSQGFGRAIAEQLLEEGALVIINARKEEPLQTLCLNYPDRLSYVHGDITTDAVISEIFRRIGPREVHGFVLNAGGPPALRFMDTQLKDWDEAYAKILRWKVKFTQEILEKFQIQGFGRLLYIESMTVKQPLENLVLSNALRLAVVGLVKTITKELGPSGITLNIIAPGYHATNAMERLFIAKSALLGITPEEARISYEKETLTGSLGDPKDLASLIAWLLSDHSKFITGQTISLDGGVVQGTWG